MRVVLASRRRRNASIGRVFVHGSRQLAGQAVEYLLLRQSGLLFQLLQDIRTDRLLKFGRRDLPVRPVIDPGLRGVTLTVLFKVLEKFADPAVEQRTHATAADEATQVAA